MRASLAFSLRLTGAIGACSVTLAIATGAYLASALGLDPVAWRQLLGIIGFWIVPFFAIGSRFQHRVQQPVLSTIDEGLPKDPREAAERYTAILALPGALARTGTSVWWAGIFTAAITAAIRIPDFGPFQVFAMLSAGLGASTISAVLGALISKRMLRPVQQRAAAQLPGDALGAQLRRGSLGTRLLAAFCATGVVPVLLCVLLVVAHRGDPQALMYQLALVSCGTVLLAAAVAALLSNDVAANLADLRDSMQRIAAGDLRTRVVVDSDDEVGELAAGCVQLQRHLATTVQQMTSAAERVEDSTRAVQGVNRQVAAASDAQNERIAETTRTISTVASEASGVASSAHRLEEVVDTSSSAALELGASSDQLQQVSSALLERMEGGVSALDQIAASSSNVAERVVKLGAAADAARNAVDDLNTAAGVIDRDAGETGDLARSVIEASEQGRSRVELAARGMQQIQRVVGSGVSAIEELRGEVAQIRDVVDLIDAVADETHLLSLNAAIIAAQAGDHGHSFEVVAGEIRGLADRVSARTGEISQLIASVENSTESAVGAMLESRSAVDEGLSLGSEAVASLETIADASRSSGSHVDEILGAIHRQSMSTREIHERIEQVASGIASIGEAVAEQALSQEEMVDLGVSVRDAANTVFRSAGEQGKVAETIRVGVTALEDTARGLLQSMELQAQSCTTSLSRMEELRNQADRNRSSVLHLDASLGELERESEAMRELAERFELPDTAAASD